MNRCRWRWRRRRRRLTIQYDRRMPNMIILYDEDDVKGCKGKNYNNNNLSM